jgi:histidine phosphotransferase ChpT
VSQGQTTLAETLAARICHDLIGPLGAIGNGIELLNMQDATVSPELELIGSATGTAIARLQFFRIAYGSGQGDQMFTAGDLASRSAAYFRGSRITCQWPDPAEILARRRAKLIFLLILCLESSLHAGGSLIVSSQAIRATGPARPAQQDAWLALAAAAAPPPDLLFTLARSALAQNACRLQVTTDQAAMTLTLLPARL